MGQMRKLKYTVNVKAHLWLCCMNWCLWLVTELESYISKFQEKQWCMDINNVASKRNNAKLAGQSKLCYLLIIQYCRHYPCTGLWMNGQMVKDVVNGPCTLENSGSLSVTRRQRTREPYSLSYVASRLLCHIVVGLVGIDDWWAINL